MSICITWDLQMYFFLLLFAANCCEFPFNVLPNSHTCTMRTDCQKPVSPYHISSSLFFCRCLFCMVMSSASISEVTPNYTSFYSDGEAQQAHIKQAV